MDTDILPKAAVTASVRKRREITAFIAFDPEADIADNNSNTTPKEEEE